MLKVWLEFDYKYLEKLFLLPMSYILPYVSSEYYQLELQSVVSALRGFYPCYLLVISSNCGRFIIFFRNWFPVCKQAFQRKISTCNLWQSEDFKCIWREPYLKLSFEIISIHSSTKVLRSSISTKSLICFYSFEQLTFIFI